MADQFESYTPDPKGHLICAVQPLGISRTGTVLRVLHKSAHCMKSSFWRLRPWLVLDPHWPFESCRASTRHFRCGRQGSFAPIPGAGHRRAAVALVSAPLVGTYLVKTRPSRRALSLCVVCCLLCVFVVVFAAVFASGAGCSRVRGRACLLRRSPLLGSPLPGPRGHGDHHSVQRPRRPRLLFRFCCDRLCFLLLVSFAAACLRQRHTSELPSTSSLLQASEGCGIKFADIIDWA